MTLVGLAASGALWGQTPLPLDRDLRGRTAAARRWLEGQVTPNHFVPEPDASRRGLLVSYSLTPKQFPVGYHRSATYDDAVGALAFLVMGDRDRAAFTLHALTRLVRPDGSLWFAYNTANNWPSESDHESALVRAGTVAWVGYALTLYLARRPGGPPGVDDREHAVFLETARQLARYLLSLQVNDSSDPRDGLLRLGYGSITLAFDTASHQVVELYRDEPVTGISTENNIIAWFFLRRLGGVSDDQSFSNAANRIGNALLASLWNDGLGQFNQGFTAQGKPDSNKALDCASLGALFLAARGDHDRAERAIAAAERYYASRSGKAIGYRPYADRTVYDDEAVGRFFFPQTPRTEWQDLPVVWSEGSLQLALAYQRLGRPEQARHILLGLDAMRVASGGVRYASMDVPFEMSRAASVAGSAWLILVSRALAGDSLAREILR
ncbi:MAG TPA: hypothetical protein VM716_04870 [Gemmatimonadales bacterium]|nr:hypothetical protein [Gemmatimonadales bacterium]